MPLDDNNVAKTHFKKRTIPNEARASYCYDL
jgi:hypothetical protein